ncbi:carbohydrate kinase [Allosaccharopolyspora coralli]|uniref:Carbohydrate kinase n=1 Tax=Allosaccharopolyspora coralli TaxID=2665642 RepID=A0A5Q3QAV6_9PSEU|nr:carbohydrate kinase [Allosaccharopolyspora coralli]QGK68605.1 carbohydrate kinase [Allosaccharopolyspora coralli]
MIVVGGDALVDLVPDPSTGDGELGPLHPRLGGGPYNVAIALGRLGAPAGFFSRISTDQFGDKLVERLCRSDVDIRLVQRGPEPTTLAVVGLAEDGTARYSFHTCGTAGRAVCDPGPLPDDVRALSFGTSAMVLRPGAAVYEALLEREAARGRFIALDPNVRPALIDDPARCRERFREWLPSIGLLKLSIEDATWLVDDPTADLVEALREWSSEGPAAVVLTRGACGMSVLTGDGDFVDVPARPAQVVDTIGAGDTVQAALLAWLDRHGLLSTAAVRRLGAEQWRAALTHAAAAAAITVARPGAEPPFLAEVPG